MTRPYLGNPKYTIEVLQKYNFAFQKRFGQNFLIDTHVLEKIIRCLSDYKRRFCAGNRTGNWNDDTVSGRGCQRSGSSRD